MSLSALIASAAVIGFFVGPMIEFPFAEPRQRSGQLMLTVEAENYEMLAQAYESLERAKNEACADRFVYSAEKFRQKAVTSAEALCP